jgi:hypothetical protein
LDPPISRKEIGYSSRAIIDTTRPFEWRDKFPEVSGASRELKDRVAGKWKHFLNEKFGGS